MFRFLVILFFLINYSNSSQITNQINVKEESIPLFKKGLWEENSSKLGNWYFSSCNLNNNYFSFSINNDNYSFYELRFQKLNKNEALIQFINVNSSLNSMGIEKFKIRRNLVVENNQQFYSYVFIDKDHFILAETKIFPNQTDKIILFDRNLNEIASLLKSDDSWLINFFNINSQLNTEHGRIFVSAILTFEIFSTNNYDFDFFSTECIKLVLFSVLKFALINIFLILIIFVMGSILGLFFLFICYFVLFVSNSMTRIIRKFIVHKKND